MKKIITILAITATISLASASIDGNLKYGMKGNQVSELQDFLADKGFLTSQPSGFFGLLTLKAVKAYQLSVGLPNSGFVGQMTRTKINESISIDTFSSKEAEVKEIGTTTIVTPTPQIIYVQQAPQIVQVVAPQAIQPVEDVYTLNLGEVKEYEDFNNYCHCTMVIGFSIKPVATLNGKAIEVISCTLPTLQLTEKFRKEYNDVAFHASSGDYPRRIRSNEAGIVNCILANGKVLSN